jgi:haloalkane dehalogenase
VVAFSDADPITRGADKPFRKLIPGAAGLDHPVLPGGHFVQEDCPEQIAALIAQLASPPDLRVPPPAK